MPWYRPELVHFVLNITSLIHFQPLYYVCQNFFNLFFHLSVLAAAALRSMELVGGPSQSAEKYTNYAIVALLGNNLYTNIYICESVTANNLL